VSASAILLVVLPVADILFNQDFIIWMIGPPVASLAVLVVGLLVRTHSPKVGSALLVFGIGALILSAAWIAFAVYVDTVLGDT
jgi:hypothetical protein